MVQPTGISFSPFAILTNRLFILPTPIAVLLPNYRMLYASLHADPSFCEMAFSDNFPAVSWDDEQTSEVIKTRDVQRCWGKRGMGDFAVGLQPAYGELKADRMRKLGGTNSTVYILEQNDYSSLFSSSDWDPNSTEWVGYAGVRDATTTSMPERTAADPPLPPWLEMIELRYGVASGYWGKGIAREAAEAVMQWATSEKGVKRFIAETERANARSGNVLGKLGFRMSGTGYWKDPEEVEWEKLTE